MRFPHVRPTVSLTAGGFLVVSASSFGIVTVATSASQPGADRAGPPPAAQVQTVVAQAQTSAVSGASSKQCEMAKPAGTPSPTGSSTTQPPNTPASSTATAPTTTPANTGSGSTAPTTASTPAPTPDPSPTTTSSSGSTAGASPSDTSGSGTAAAFNTRQSGSAPVAATLLGLTQADASSPQAYLCVSAQRDEASITRGRTAQWNLSVWAKGGNISSVILHLATSPSSQKPRFSNGCAAKEGTNSCAVGRVDSGSAARQMQAQVPVAATATSVKTVKLTFWGSSPEIKTGPKAAIAIAVTAPKPGGTTGAAGVGTVTPGTPTPAGVNSKLPVGRLPFLGGGAGSSTTLSPGGNAASLFPTLHPGGVPGAADGGSRARMTADELPGNASLVGAQYAGLGALALAFVLSVTRLSIRRRRTAGHHGGAQPG